MMEVVVVAEGNPDCQLHGFQTGPGDSFDKVVEAPTATEISGETSAAAGQTTHWKNPNLVLEIPSKVSPDVLVQEHESVKISIPATPTPRRVNFLLTQSATNSRANPSSSPSPSPSSKGKSPFKNLLPRLSFKHRGLSSDVEKGGQAEAAASASGPVAECPREKASISRSLSLMFSPRIKRALSFPVAPDARTNMKGAISRSLSVPANGKDKKFKSQDSIFRVIARDGDSIAPDKAQNDVPDGEDIPEEEAVCRICFVELGEGGQTLKLECSCRGELALAHHDCAVKWFSIKGNQTCDICKREVLNLPVTLLRIPSLGSRSPPQFRGYSAWHDIPILAIISVLAYFCFLEELLVGKMSAGAISISLPLCFILALLSSITSYTVVKRRFMWIYAATQFALVVFFAHIFYSAVRIQAVLSILLGTFAGFGVAITGSSILVEFFRWRRIWLARSAQAASDSLTRHSQSQTTLVAGSSSRSNHSISGEHATSG